MTNLLHGSKLMQGFNRGCLFSTSLLTVYINNLAQRINDRQCGIKIDDLFVSILLYADDIELIAPDELKLQQMLDVVTSWCSEWELYINASKTQIVLFTNPSVQRGNFIFPCSNSNIEYVESYKLYYFTYISPQGKSVVDYMCVPYEQLNEILDFKVLKMTDIINQVNVNPESIPDHSI